MKANIQISIIVGGIYEVRGDKGKAVRFKFVHANTLGLLTIEINGVQSEVSSIAAMVQPEEWAGLHVIDAPTHF